MPYFKRQKPRKFIVSALLGTPGEEEVDFLSIIKDQLGIMGRIIRDKDPELLHDIIDNFENEVEHKQRLRQEMIHHRENS